MTASECREVFAFIRVDSAAVDGYVPPTFPLYVGAEDGQAQVMVTHRYCASMTIAGARRAGTSEARFGAVVKRPHDSTNDCGPPNVDICNFYMFFWATDHPQLVGWLREGTGLAPEIAMYVKDLRHAYSPLVPGAYDRVDVVAPAPTPSPIPALGPAERYHPWTPLSPPIGGPKPAKESCASRGRLLHRSSDTETGGSSRPRARAYGRSSVRPPRKAGETLPAPLRRAGWRT